MYFRWRDGARRLVVVGLWATLPSSAGGAPELDTERLTSLLSGALPFGAGPCSTAIADLADILPAVEGTSNDSLLHAVHARIGGLHMRMGRGEDALDAFTTALDHANATGDVKTRSIALSDVARANGLKGNFDTVVEVSRRNLDLIRGATETNLSTSPVWTLIAAAYNMLGRHPEALAANDSLLSLARADGDSMSLANGYARQAAILVTMGEVRAALALSDSSLAYTDRHPPPTLRMKILRDRAAILTSLYRDDDALAAVEGCLELARTIGNDREVLFGVIRHAEVLHAMGRAVEALPLLDEIDRLAPPGMSRALAVQLLTIRASALVETERYAEADSVIRGALDDFRLEWEEAGEDAARLGLYQRAGAVFAVAAASAGARGDWPRAWHSLEWGTAPTLRATATGRPDPLSLEVLQDVLRRERAVVLQWADDDWSVVPGVVVGADDVRGLEFDRAAAFEAMDAVRAEVASGVDLAELKADLSRLSEAIGLTDVVWPSGTERVYLVIPGAWADIPFELLPLGDDASRRLGETFAVSFVPNASAISYLGDRTPGEGMVVFADPTVTDDATTDAFLHRGRRLDPLPNARKEADDVSVPGADVWVGEKATVEAFRSEAVDRAAVLHFATHAVVWPQSPDRNTIVLSDGRPKASDIEARILHADLVALSACQTAAGHAYRGEGAVGLERSFFLAGARSVVATRWDVSDRAARDFMREFYAVLRAGAPRDVALQTASQSLRDQGYPPREFAAFRLAGLGHRPVAALQAAGAPTTNPSTTWWLVGAGGLVLAAGAWWRRRAVA